MAAGGAASLLSIAAVPGAAVGVAYVGWKSIRYFTANEDGEETEDGEQTQDGEQVQHGEDKNPITIDANTLITEWQQHFAKHDKL